MLKILDRYIIRKFLTTFFFMLGVIMILAMVFDLAERLSEFIDNQAPISEIIFGYYVNFLIYYGNTFSSMIIFISVIWFTAKMAQETEIIPMLNSGRPFIRIMRPYMIAATILMLMSLLLNHFVLPRSNRVRLDFEERYYRDNLVVENYNAEFPGHQFVHFANYIATANLVNEFVVEQYNDKNQLIRFVKARSAVGRPNSNKWQLIDYYERKITPPVEVINEIGEKELQFTNDVIIEGKKKDTLFPFKISELAQRDNVAEAMTFTELTDFIRKEKSKGNPKVPSYEIELHQRTSYPFATYVLTLIGVSVASRKKRGGIGINIAIGFVFVFIYIFAMKVTTVAAIKVGFPPVAAVWIPNFIFGIFALFLYRVAPK
ncbi:MAG: LptF/LptG family permease [Fluviicola sp.]|nr:LptF/LptG family permease [Fluviicola sp.]